MRNWVLAKLSTDTQDSDAPYLLSVYKQASGYTQEYIELELESLAIPSVVLDGLRAIKLDMEKLDSPNDKHTPSEKYYSVIVSSKPCKETEYSE